MRILVFLLVPIISISCVSYDHRVDESSENGRLEVFITGGFNTMNFVVEISKFEVTNYKFQVDSSSGLSGPSLGFYPIEAGKYQLKIFMGDMTPNYVRGYCVEQFPIVTEVVIQKERITVVVINLEKEGCKYDINSFSKKFDRDYKKVTLVE